MALCHMALTSQICFRRSTIQRHCLLPSVMIDIVSPLAPSVTPRLLPEFVEYWNNTPELVGAPGLDTLPWDPSIRSNAPQPGGSAPLPVNIQDLSVRDCSVRIFAPEGEVPDGGWPIMIYFHGGGWTLGSIDTENVIASHFCKRAEILVISVDYRLAPEHPFPAATRDAQNVFEWLLDNAPSLHGNLSRLGVGGSSSGANLAAFLSHYAALRTPPVPLTFQYLNVPVVDCTAKPSTAMTVHPYPSWVENADAPSLTPSKMIWYRNNYLPLSSPSHLQDVQKWQASPIYAPDEAFRRSPAKTFIAVCSVDILRDEGLAYAEKLRSFGQVAEVKVYEGAPHPVMAMDKALKVGAQCIDDAVTAAKLAYMM